jgi:membrane-associated progesterone receptor component
MGNAQSQGGDGNSVISGTTTDNNNNNNSNNTNNNTNTKPRTKAIDGPKSESQRSSLEDQLDSVSLVPDFIVTKEELSKFTGNHCDHNNKEKRIYLCCKQIVYDVTQGRDFYGPDGPYANFAGRDASRALALMSLKLEDCVNPSLADLTDEQEQTLNDWEKKFKSKYRIVGRYQAD